MSTSKVFQIIFALSFTGQIAAMENYELTQDVYDEFYDFKVKDLDYYSNIIRESCKELEQLDLEKTSHQEIYSFCLNKLDESLRAYQEIVNDKLMHLKQLEGRFENIESETITPPDFAAMAKYYIALLVIQCKKINLCFKYLTYQPEDFYKIIDDSSIYNKLIKTVNKIILRIESNLEKYAQDEEEE